MLSGGSFQVLLLLILVICISVFFFFELRKINIKITSQDILIQKFTEDFNNLQNEISKNDLEMDKITHDLKDSKIENNFNDISGGFSPTTNKEPIYVKSENTLSEFIPLKNESFKELDNTQFEKVDIPDNESDNDSQHESDDGSDDDSHHESDDRSDDGSDDISEDSELDIDEITKELQEMSVKELKLILQEKELALSGNKTTMINRIINSLK